MRTPHKRLQFSKHFWSRFEWRKKNAPVELIEELVMEAIIAPDMVRQDPNHSNREWRIKRVNGYCLKVVVEEMGEHIFVITLFFDRGLRRQGLCG